MPADRFRGQVTAVSPSVFFIVTVAAIGLWVRLGTKKVLDGEVEELSGDVAQQLLNELKKADHALQKFIRKDGILQRLEREQKGLGTRSMRSRSAGSSCKRTWPTFMPRRTRARS